MNTEKNNQAVDGMKVQMKETLEQRLGEIVWSTEDEGYCRCPGWHLHTSPNGERDCKIYLNPVVTLTCFHGSCREVVDATNRELRKAAATGKFGSKTKFKLTPEQKLQRAKRAQQNALRIRTAGSVKSILRQYRWPYDEILADSPLGVAGNEEGHYFLALDLFHEEDVVWIGELMDSGQPTHRRYFKKAAEWKSRSHARSCFICPSVFKPGSYSRNKESVAALSFLVVESDTLDKDTVGGIFRWMKDQCGLHLRCIVDTGGKSLHGWFDFPTEDELADLKIILPELGCDPKMFNATQPCRLPGGWRKDKWQKFIYLEGGAA